MGVLVEFLRVVIGLAGAVTIYVIGAALLRKFKVEPEPEPDPAQLRPVEVEFRCTICGTTVVMTDRRRRRARAAPALPGGHGPRLGLPKVPSRQFPTRSPHPGEKSVGSYTSEICVGGGSAGYICMTHSFEEEDSDGVADGRVRSHIVERGAVPSTMESGSSRTRASPRSCRGA